MDIKEIISQVTPASPSCALQVLGADELLTLVMSHLDIQTLLLSQRVSKAWRTAFNMSSLLQTRAMLQPTNPQAKMYHSRQAWNPLLYNMVLKSDDATDGVYWTCHGTVLGYLRMVQHRPSTSTSCYCHISTKPSFTTGSWQGARVSDSLDCIRIEGILENERGRIPDRHLRIGIPGFHITIGDIMYMLERWAAVRLIGGWPSDHDYVNGDVTHNRFCANHPRRKGSGAH